MSNRAKNYEYKLAERKKKQNTSLFTLVSTTTNVHISTNRHKNWLVIDDEMQGKFKVGSASKHINVLEYSNVKKFFASPNLEDFVGPTSTTNLPTSRKGQPPKSKRDIVKKGELPVLKEIPRVEIKSQIEKIDNRYKVKLTDKVKMRKKFDKGFGQKFGEEEFSVGLTVIHAPCRKARFNKRNESNKRRVEVKEAAKF